MQGWFSHTFNFLPNSSILPVWVGTHFDEATQRYLKEVACIGPSFLQQEIGCRDLYTLSFCQSLGMRSYFSRCLTLTLPKRLTSEAANKVYLVNVPKEWESLFPENLTKECIRINQKWQRRPNESWSEYLNYAEQLLDDYKKNAKLVITTALHCASPCVAMGIPVILISEKVKENSRRFSALDGILQYSTLQDLQNQAINFNPDPINIEELKIAMKENLSLSISKACGNNVSDNELADIRAFISNFQVQGVNK